MSGKSLISETTAKQIIDMLVRHAIECHQLAAHLHTQTSPEEFRQYGPLIGTVMSALYDEGMVPLFKLYPHLKPEDYP